MNNLELENLSPIVNSISSGVASSTSTGGAGFASELKAAQEMKIHGLESAPPPGGATFSDVLRSSMNQVNEYQHQADHAIKELVAGRSKNIHETMLTIERADTSLKLMMQVRNKILDAYKEIMHMQV